MSYERWQNLPEMFFEQAERHAGRGFLRWKRDGAWQSLGYREAATEVRALACGLLGLGIKPGDRVVILSESRAEWPIADLAIMAAGGVTVPAYTTNTTADHRHVLTHSGAVAAIVSGKALAKRFLPAAIEAPELRFIVAVEDLELAQRVGKAVHRWAEVKSEGARTPEGLLEQRIAALKRKDTACFIYTSGTGGTPKGAADHRGQHQRHLPLRPGGGPGDGEGGPGRNRLHLLHERLVRREEPGPLQHLQGWRRGAGPLRSARSG